MNSRHPDPQRVRNGGLELRLLTPDPGDSPGSADEFLTYDFARDVLKKVGFGRSKYLGPGTWYQEKSERAGSGTLTHPNRDKIFTKWVAINAPELPRAGFCTEFRAGSF